MNKTFGSAHQVFRQSTRLGMTVNRVQMKPTKFFQTVSERLSRKVRTIVKAKCKRYTSTEFLTQKYYVDTDVDEVVQHTSGHFENAPTTTRISHNNPHVNAAMIHGKRSHNSFSRFSILFCVDTCSISQHCPRLFQATNTSSMVTTLF